MKDALSVAWGVVGWLWDTMWEILLSKRAYGVRVK